jgi:tRNA (mo5U34)-methyltransferase
MLAIFKVGDRRSYMHRDELEKRVASISWYHEFDFPNGLKARSQAPDVAGRRAVWAFIRHQLDKIDFAGKTVLDIGCWDGMWSFYAEQRRAGHVLATDNLLQNWGSGEGIRLARELLNSSVEIDQQRSIYDLASMNRTFDIVLCLGVYYHLHDPFYAFSQIRHCCHENSIVVFEGDTTIGLKANTALIDFSNRHTSIFIPTITVLNEMIEATYFKISTQRWMGPQNITTGPRIRLQRIPDHLDFGLPRRTSRLITVASPLTGTNRLHIYPPPFGLARYDPRFGS